MARLTHLWDKSYGWQNNSATAVFRLEQNNIDYYRHGTHDMNPVHDPARTQHPIALGFQLEFLVKQIADRYVFEYCDENDLPKHYFHSQKTSFIEKVHPVRLLNVSIVKRDDAMTFDTMLKGRSLSSGEDPSQVLKQGSFIKYADNLPQGDDIPFAAGKRHCINLHEVALSALGMGTLDPDPFAHAIALSSDTLIQTLADGSSDNLDDKSKAEFADPDNRFVYGRHTISAYEASKNLQVGDQITISMTYFCRRESRAGTSYGVEMTGYGKDTRPIYQVTLLLAKE